MCKQQADKFLYENSNSILSLTMNNCCDGKLALFWNLIITSNVAVLLCISPCTLSTHRQLTDCASFPLSSCLIDFHLCLFKSYTWRYTAICAEWQTKHQWRHSCTILIIISYNRHITWSATVIVNPENNVQGYPEKHPHKKTLSIKLLIKHKTKLLLDDEFHWLLYLG